MYSIQNPTKLYGDLFGFKDEMFTLCRMCFERDVELLSDTTNKDTAPPKRNTDTYKSSLFIDCIYSINKNYRVKRKKEIFKVYQLFCKIFISYKKAIILFYIHGSVHRESN